MVVSNQNLLSETVAILDAVRARLMRKQTENRAEIADISSVIKRLQGEIRISRQEAHRGSQKENCYVRKIRKVHEKKAELLRLIKRSHEQESGEEL